jgi:hypothetical protein
MVMPRESGASSIGKRCGLAGAPAITGSSAFADDDILMVSQIGKRSVKHDGAR